MRTYGFIGLVVLAAIVGLAAVSDTVTGREAFRLVLLVIILGVVMTIAVSIFALASAIKSHTERESRARQQMIEELAVKAELIASETRVVTERLAQRTVTETRVRADAIELQIAEISKRIDAVAPVREEVTEVGEVVKDTHRIVKERLDG